MPNARPTESDTPNAMTTERYDTIVLMPAIRSMPELIPVPTRMPATPPATLMSTASLRNWKRMSRWVAPTARRTPISRIRSSTEASMMFMIPMPPTTSEIEAIAPRTTLKIVLVRCSCRSSSSGTVISKSITPLCRRASIRWSTVAVPGTSRESAIRTMIRSSWFRLVRSWRCSSDSLESAVTKVPGRAASSMSR